MLAGLVQAVLSVAQSDSIITFADLRFQTAFEKSAYGSFVRYQSDTIDAFLAVDEHLCTDSVIMVHQAYLAICKELESKGIGKKKPKAQVMMIFNLVKKRCQTTYNKEATLTSTLIRGSYNEWTVTPIVAMLLDRYRINYVLSSTLNQIRLVVNLGANEFVLMAGNPYPVVVEYPIEYQRKYVEFLRVKGLVSDEDMRLYSVNELFEQHSKKEKPISLVELLGLEYNVLAYKWSRQGNSAASLMPAQKAYYLYPAPETQLVLLNGLSEKMSHFSVKQCSDIDYLIQFQLITGIDAVRTNAYFSQEITKLLQDPTQLLLCDSIYEQLIHRLTNQKVIDEIGFTYNVKRINQKNLAYPDLFYADKAACIQPFNKELCDYAELILVNYLGKINDETTRKDSIGSLLSKLKSNRLLETLRAQQLALLLSLAKDAFQNKRPSEGEHLLQEFETVCPTPVKNAGLARSIELAFYDMAIAVYWNNKQDYAANARMIQRGLKFVPESVMLKSGAYEKKVEPINSNKRKEKIYSF